MAHVHGAASAAQMGKSAAEVAGQGMMGKGMAVTGAAAMAGTHAVRSVVGKILKHPLVLFGLGVAVGYTVHKYRKEIIGSANRVAEKSKDFVLQQRENLEDLVGETPETES